MNKKLNFKRLLSIFWQLDILLLPFVWLFSIIPYSHYSKTWAQEYLSIIGTLRFLSIFLLCIFIAGTIISAFFSRAYFSYIDWKGVLYSAVLILILFFIHIVIRKHLVGSYQLSDGLIYFNQMDWLLSYPNILFDNFIHNGVIAGGHIAHGFMFTYALGQFVDTINGMGFQYGYAVMGAIACCFLYGIFRKLLPTVSKLLCAIAAFIVSVQPMFLGLSTIAQMEYMITIAFIYSIFFILYRQYLLAAFWLVILGTCKETGLMMAFGLVGWSLLLYAFKYIHRNGGLVNSIKSLSMVYKIILLCIMAFITIAFILAINTPFWFGYRIIDVIRLGGSGTMNFSLSSTHLLLKLRQLYVLNFSWLWLLLMLVCVVLNYSVPYFREKNTVDGFAFSYIIVSYIAYTAFLLLFQEANQPRYNMLSDMLFLLLAATVITKVLSALLPCYFPVISVMTVLTLIQVFVNIDPVSTSLFTHINTGGKYPILWTITTRKDTPEVLVNPGDFGMYNYQYTFLDRAIDKVLDTVDYQNWYSILSTSIALDEDQLNCKSLVWDSINRTRTYNAGDPDRFFIVERQSYMNSYNKWDRDVRCILIQTPYFEDKLEEAYKLFKDYYDIQGPYTVNIGISGSLTYYYMMLR